MASSSSNALMPSSSSSRSVMYNGKWEYDVFVCFRGADTRDGFTSHLMEALSREQIKAFMDDMLDKTENIDQLISVLRRSALSIVIFSENFADSSWCLDEVVTISQSMVDFGHRALPVFYKVDPSDVSEDSGSYAATIELTHGASNIPVDRKSWMDALKAVANCAGHTSQKIKNEAELVKAIVKDVLKRLVDMSSRVKSDILIGMDARVSEVEKLLSMNIDDFRIIGLWGMGGVGKTTLAKACYQWFVSSGKEMKNHFVQDINEKLQKQCTIERMVQEIYSMLLSEDNLDYQNLGIGYRRERLSRLRVFLVLDNVETSLQLEHLLLGDILNPTNLFAPGSIIILTTRNRKVLETAGACIYDVMCLHPHESLQLFGLHAFRQCLPPDDWADLAGVAVSYCKGSPLAIKVLGGALFRRDKTYWKSFLIGLGKVSKPEIHDLLRRSYDMLEIVEKKVFLDIAFFFQGQLISITIKYFSSIYQHADHVVEDLIDKSMFICISDGHSKKIEVHDLLRKMAWSIVNEESLDKRTRLLDSHDVHKLLTIQEANSRRSFFRMIFKAKGKHRSAFFEGGRVTEGICLDLSRANEMHLEANAFERMMSLTYLNFSYPANEHRTSRVHVPYGGLVNLPDSLRWLEWEGFPSKSLPSRFCPENLVVLVMRNSPTLRRCWEGAQPKLVNLVVLDLSHCINLVAIPDLLSSPNLEYIELQGCKILIELPSYVQYLDKLITLDLSGCTNLQSLPVKLNSQFLKSVLFPNCPKVIRCPEINSEELMTLDLMETPVEALPSAIYKIKQGGTLRLSGKHITSFPVVSVSLQDLWLRYTTITEVDYDDGHLHQGSFPRFVRLLLFDNPQLTSLSRNIWKMVSESLIIIDCPSIESLPEISQVVDGLTELKIANCRNLKSFPAGFNNMKALQDLCFAGTSIKSLPASVLKLDQLAHLNLSLNKCLESVPSNIHKLAKLSVLSLAGCSRIQSLPELPLNLLILDVSGCKSLQALPSNIGRVRWKSLDFQDCLQLDTNLTKEMVLNFPNHAASNLHRQGVLQYSGSEIPEWFFYRTSTYENVSYVEVQWHPKVCTKMRLIKGIIFGVKCSSDVGMVWAQMRCDCIIGTSVVASWSSSFCLGQAESDCVYIWYEKNLLGETNQGIQEGAEEPWYVKYAAGLTGVSFIFSSYADEGKDYKIKRIGISLLY